MKFINLINSKENLEESYDCVVKYNCGPNFVLNRRNDFELMLRTQGLVFLFRFWLSFCFDPGCFAMKLIFTKCPHLKIKPLIDIHKKFLEGTLEDAIKYSLEEIILPLKILDPAKDYNDKTIEEVVFNCSRVVFGAALCKVFHLWLDAKEMDNNSPPYWTIPSKYLKPKFKPGLLEKYLVNHWQDDLVQFLGVNLKQIPWFLKLLYCETFVSNIPKEVSSIDQRIIKMLQVCTENERQRMLCADELPCDEEKKYKLLVLNDQQEKESNHKNISLYLLNCILGKKSKCIFTNVKKGNIYKNKEKRLKPELFKCCFCAKMVNSGKMYRKCQVCVKKNWVPIRRYCSDKCQMEHWFQLHQVEHRRHTY